MTKNIGQPGWEGLFASPTLARLLAQFLTHPDTAFYQRELLGAARAQLYTVQQALGRLERTGIVTKRPGGNRVYYQANRAHPAFEDLRRVILKTVGLGDALRAALAPVADRIRVAAIYGSLARGGRYSKKRHRPSAHRQPQPSRDGRAFGPGRPSDAGRHHPEGARHDFSASAPRALEISKGSSRISPNCRPAPW